MGLFGLFGSKEEREQAALRKLAKKVTERYGPPENRQKAIQQLGDMGTTAALGTLCLRFTVRAEPGITDDEEKETTRRILEDAGAAALPAVEAFIQEQESGIAWGLRALAGIAPAEKVVEIAVRELSRLGRTYTRDPEKKRVLLTWLAEHHPDARSAEIEGALLPLLEDFSDDIRIASARALAGLGPSEPAREGLIQLLLRDIDNARVRGEVLEALVRLGADVKGHRPRVEALLVEPYFLDREGHVKKRG
jgi:HEAT repeat protein